jgi:cytidine deaminase
MNREKLSVKDVELIDKAVETADQLYLKDVHEVAASLRTQAGLVFSGIHIEADVGFADICGEVAAICHAVAHGHRDINTIVAVYRDDVGRTEILPPCGRCREVISDLNPHCWVIVGTLDDPFKVDVAELLPLKSGDSGLW